MPEFTDPLAVFEALSWLCANHPDRKIKESAYEFSVALEWKDGGEAGLIDTATLQSWEERGRAIDPEQAADRFVEAVEDVLLKSLAGSHRAGSLRGLIGLGFSRRSRDEKIASLREASHDDPALSCYRDYISCCDSSELDKWLCAAALAVGIRRAGSDGP